MQRGWPGAAPSQRSDWLTDLQARLRLHLSEMMDRIAKDWKT